MRSHDLLAYYRRLSQATLTVVDVETTGYLGNGNRVIEVSLLQASLEKGILHQQTTLVNPPAVVPQPITRLTGITQAMVDQAPLAHAVWPDYWPLLNQGILTAHNLPFDYGFLQAEAQQMGITFRRSAVQQFCTLQLARILLPDLPSRALPALVEHFHLTVSGSHRAEADTLACWQLAQCLLGDIAETCESVMLSRLARQWIPLSVASQILGCSQQQARLRLEKAEITARVQENGRIFYRRDDVEQLS
ncbi:MAG: 3'-5' exonuclease [Cyanobacteriota bacterium]|nr:3'-5' exonuclease [Cyanobacteriota bacterium]